MLLEELLNHIVSIYDETNNKIDYTTLVIKHEKRKYSSTYSNILYIDDVSLTSKQLKTYKVKYICRCGRENVILLHKYLVKEKIVCQHCLQDRSYSDCIITNNLGKNKGKKTVKKQSVKLNNFYELTDIEKNKYQHIHLTEQEFYKYLPYFYKINNTIINDNIINSIKYYYAEYHPYNQFKFVPKISFDNGLTKETIKAVYLKCNICDKVFKIHIFNIRNKDLTNIKCKKCGLTNHRYTIRKYNNSNNLTYQSNVEKTFIDKCYENNVLIENGIIINYIFNNKQHKYITDFYLPEYKYMIEIKSDNIWYKQNVETGKFAAKVNAANKYSEENNMKYFVVFDYEIDTFFNTIILKR